MLQSMGSQRVKHNLATEQQCSSALEGEAGRLRLEKVAQAAGTPVGMAVGAACPLAVLAAHPERSAGCLPEGSTPWGADSGHTTRPQCPRHGTHVGREERGSGQSQSQGGQSVPRHPTRHSTCSGSSPRATLGRAGQVLSFHTAWLTFGQSGHSRLNGS